MITGNQRPTFLVLSFTLLYRNEKFDRSGFGLCLLIIICMRNLCYPKLTENTQAES